MNELWLMLIIELEDSSKDIELLLLGDGRTAGADYLWLDEPFFLGTVATHTSIADGAGAAVVCAGR